MEIRTKPQLIKQLKKIGEMKIKQGVCFKELALSIEYHKEQKTFQEWLKMVNKYLELEDADLINKYGI